MHKNEVCELSDLYQKIEKLCKQKNINVTTLCRESGVSRGNITDLKKGRHRFYSVTAFFVYNLPSISSLSYSG